MTTPSPSSLLDSLSAINDCARLRILRLLETHELSVGECSDVLQLPQSTVSRHLKLLLETGFVSRRTIGTTGLYRISDAMPKEALNLWGIASSGLNDLPESNEDNSRLLSVLAERRTDSRNFFKTASNDWESLRNEMYGQRFTPTALLSLLDSSLSVLDIGCGIGNAATIVAPFVKHVVGVDREAAMLTQARQRLGLPENITFVRGDATSLPAENNAFDIAMFCLVLHHIEDTVAVLKEASRVLKKNGRILVIDMQNHVHDEYWHTLGHVHLGFSEEDMQSLAESVSLQLLQYHRLIPNTNVSGPSLFSAVLG